MGYLLAKKGLNYGFLRAEISLKLTLGHYNPLQTGVETVNSEPNHVKLDIRISIRHDQGRE
jgi:hypothetical protein